MRMRETERGFRIGEFTDANGVPCSIQESSRVTGEDGAYLWLGCNEVGLKRFDPGRGWSDVELPGGDGVSYNANTRMHLTQKMAGDLLPALRHFADHGDLPGDVGKRVLDIEARVDRASAPPLRWLTLAAVVLGALAAILMVMSALGRW